MSSSVTATEAEEDRDEHGGGLSGGDESTGLITLEMAPRDYSGAKNIWNGFLCMSVLVSVNISCAIACMVLAIARLHGVGAISSGFLYLSYTLSAVFGVASLSTKILGARNAMGWGMALFCVYVVCFLIATQLEQGATTTTADTVNNNHRLITSVIAIGSILGGVGGGIVWTAQGTYMAQAAEAYTLASGLPWESSTSKFAAAFAFVYLMAEMAVTALSTILSDSHVSWSKIFLVYAMLALISTMILLIWVRDYHHQPHHERGSSTTSTFDAKPNTTLIDDLTVWRKVATVYQLWFRRDSALLLLGLGTLPILFGLTSSYLHGYVSGHVVIAEGMMTSGSSSNSVGLLTAWSALVAALMSLVYERIHVVFCCHLCNKNSSLNNKKNSSKATTTAASSIVLFLGTLSFTAVPFFSWWFFQQGKRGTATTSKMSLLLVYALHGSGRAVYESSLKSWYADLFPYETEGAFATLVLQMGLASVLGYFLFGMMDDEDDNNSSSTSENYLDHIKHFQAGLWCLGGTTMIGIGYVVAVAANAQASLASGSNNINKPINDNSFHHDEESEGYHSRRVSAHRQSSLLEYSRITLIVAQDDDDDDDDDDDNDNDAVNEALTFEQESLGDLELHDGELI